MHRGCRYLGTLLLTAALGTPIANAKPLISGQEHEEHERDRDAQRVYDSYHHDYHNWDDREDKVYRHWLEERHEAYREYSRLKHKEQRDYWNWRHQHEEHEEHEHHN